MLPPEVTVRIDRATWTPQPVFDLVRRVGEVAQPDLEQTLNCGVGMVALLDPDDADKAVHLPHFGSKVPVEMAIRCDAIPQLRYEL